MEAASFLADKVESLTCLDILDIPFKLVLGDVVGLALKKVGIFLEIQYRSMCQYYKKARML